VEVVPHVDAGEHVEVAGCALVGDRLDEVDATSPELVLDLRPHVSEEVD
jgi:hypothetical protein